MSPEGLSEVIGKKDSDNALYTGIDVGSTTIKAVITDLTDNTLLWKRYQRHNTRQSSCVRDFLIQIGREFPDRPLKLFITGSGGRAIAPHINARYIQEVNAVTYAVERRFPDTGSVIELGGQDAKVIIWKQDRQGRKTTLTFMNDKCAGGTGATIDKIFAKVGIPLEKASNITIGGKTIHHIAAKCGVFAETDVVGLLKSGVNKDEIVVSLCNAIVKQNLEVLVRGNVLRDRVLLLGGPHTFLGVFTELWRLEIPKTWLLHDHTPGPHPLEKLIYVPEDSQYFAALGAVLFGVESQSLGNGIPEENGKHFTGLDSLERYITEGRLVQLAASGAVKEGLISSQEEVDTLEREYSIPPFVQPVFPKSTGLNVHIGIDGGSTSSKLALIDAENKLLYRDYVLSEGNPIQDVRHMFERINSWAHTEKLDLTVSGTAVTGYAAAILQAAFNFDHSIVETIAHMRSAVTEYGDIDIICDVGGQDIKVLFLKHGRVVDFKLNTQCSAGNGFFLQSMAEQFGITIDTYAEHAFRAKKAPAFNYGCAVFMEQDRVNFQQQGWTKDEIMAGLALVLPMNIWNYVVQEPNIARFGHRIVLQGGTQKNLAAVKAQIDHIRKKVPHAQIMVHKYADICGAIGAAIEARSLAVGESGFIGLKNAAHVKFTARNDESTRCSFCGNRCHRTFIDIKSTPRRSVRFISGYGCERGSVDNIDDMRKNEKNSRTQRDLFPNLADASAKDVFAEYDFDKLPEQGDDIDPVLRTCRHTRKNPRGFLRSNADAAAKRRAMTVGIPRVLNMYLYTPFFSTYFRTLGVGRVVYSDVTSTRLWEEGNKWGAIDPCFPAKVAPAHVYNLLMKYRPTHVCFPIITHLESAVENTLGNTACVIQMGTAEVVHAVFTRDRNLFSENGTDYWKPMVRMDRPLEAQGLLYDYFSDRLSITEDENAWAVRQGYNAMKRYLENKREAGINIINWLVENNRIGILVLGHPYHHDPGLNHGILDEFQMRGFPILTIESLPTDDDFLGSLFPDHKPRGRSSVHFDIKDVWGRNFNRNTNLKIWAAKVAARHPNLAVIDFSSFKCGHDAPTYSYIDNILDASETPHFLFHDIDQSKPRASIQIRIQTIDYFLRLEEVKLRSTIGALQHG